MAKAFVAGNYSNGDRHQKSTFRITTRWGSAPLNLAETAMAKIYEK